MVGAAPAGVRPRLLSSLTLSAASLLAPFSSSRRTTSRWPYRAAQTSGVSPFCRHTRGVSAVCSPPRKPHPAVHPPRLSAVAVHQGAPAERAGHQRAAAPPCSLQQRASGSLAGNRAIGPAALGGHSGSACGAEETGVSSAVVRSGGSLWGGLQTRQLRSVSPGASRRPRAAFGDSHVTAVPLRHDAGVRLRGEAESGPAAVPSLRACARERNGRKA